MPVPTSRWCHVTLTTYGNWLPGDPRGFRTWKHRSHVEGDYKNPPVEDYAGLHHLNRARQLAPATVLTADQRPIVGVALREHLTDLGVLVLAVSVSGCHGHALGKFPPGNARVTVGSAKRHAWFRLRESGWSGRLWAKGCGLRRIRNRRHQLNVYRYILRHEREGAYVWAWHRDRNRE
jgi:hypothetical protein